MIKINSIDDRFISMRGKGGELSVISPVEGNLPMPVSGISFVQTPYSRNQGTLKYNVSDNCTAIDVLIKKEGIPQTLTDYDQKITLEELTSKNTLTINANEDGNYSPYYGIWVVSKNESGIQTALNNSNKIDFPMMYFDGQVVEQTINSSSYGTMVSRYTESMIDFEDYLFLASDASSSSHLVVIDKKTQEVTTLSGKGTLKSGFITYLFKDPQYVIVNSSGNRYRYNPKTKELIDFYNTNTDYYETHSEIHFFDRSKPTYIYVYDKATDIITKFTDQDANYRYGTKTIDGIFGTRTGYIPLKWNPSTRDHVKTEALCYYDKEGTIELPSGAQAIYDDDYGMTWLFFENSLPFHWNGSGFSTYAARSSDKYGKPTCRIKNLDGDTCVAYAGTAGTIYKLKGSHMELFATGEFSGVLSNIIEHAGGYILFNSSNTAYFIRDGIITTIGTNIYYNDAKVINDQVYVRTDVGTGVIIDGTLMIISENIPTTKFTQIGNVVYCIGRGDYDNSFYKINNLELVLLDSFSTNVTNIDILYKNGKILFIPRYPEFLKEYSLENESITNDETMKGGHILGPYIYWVPSEAKVYFIKTEMIQNVTMTSGDRIVYNDGTYEWGAVQKYINAHSVSIIYLR